MTSGAKKAIKRYRERAQRKGLVRLEVQVPRGDADAVRVVAALLRGDNQAVAERIRRELAGLARAAMEGSHLKALLESAPLGGIELERSRDLGRAVDLG